MKNVLLIVLFASLPTLMLAQNEVIKKIERSYSVSGNGSLSINGKYGDVHIDTWDAKTVEINVKIEVKKQSEKLAKEMLDKISIVIEDGNKEALSLSTRIDGSINNKSGDKLEIEYWIKAPKSLAYIIKNNYGSLYVSDNNGSNEFSVAYGNLKVENCSGKTELNLSYGNGEIASIAQGNLAIDYSNLSVDEVGDINLISNYSKVEFEKIASITSENRYGSLEAKSVRVLKGYSKYGNVAISKLYKTIDFETLHGGGLKVDWVSKGFDKIILVAKYGSLALQFEKGFGATLDADMTYCSLKFGDVPFNYTHMKEDSQHNLYKGVVGDKENAGNRIISITSSYGNGKIDYAD